MKRHAIYHIVVGDKRTTVSINVMMDNLLSVKLGLEPESASSHEAIRRWLQDRIDKDPGKYVSRASQWLQEEVLLEIVDKKLSTKYWDWRLGDPNEW